MGADCEKCFTQGRCIHGCCLEEGHDEKHECECNFEWSEEESDDD